MRSPTPNRQSGPRVSSHLASAVAAVRRTLPTEANAVRLWSKYSSVCKDDLALDELVCEGVSKHRRPIDGMTEILSCRDIFDVLSMPDCLSLEIPSVGSPQDVPEAFLMVPFATRCPDSIDVFRSYFLGDVFDPSQLRYTSESDESTFRSALDQGNMIYLSEFVSPKSAAATIALLIAAITILVDHTFSVADCIVFGKCLEAVRLGTRQNELGNQSIKRLAQSFGVRKIGEASQRRQLALSPNNAPMCNSAPNIIEEAELVFGLYMGNSAPMSPLIARYSRYLAESVLKDFASSPEM
jgi:hypothetical protein